MSKLPTALKSTGEIMAEKLAQMALKAKTVAKTAKAATEELAGRMGQSRASRGLLARSLARSVVRDYENEYKQQLAAAYKAGYKAGVAEERARNQAANNTVVRARSPMAAATRAAKEPLPVGKNFTGEAPEEIDIPLAGVSSASGWVTGAGLVKGMLAISYDSGVTCIYPDFGVADLKGILRVSSAGKWVHRHVYRAQYYFG